MDVLGFRNLLQSRDLRDIIRILRSVDSTANLGATKGIGDQRRLPPLLKMMFSDSILLAAEGDTPRDLESIVDGVECFLRQCIQVGIGIRGAIVKGQLFVSHGEPEAPAMFLGNAMTRAYELETAQKWCGAIVDMETICSPNEAELLAELTGRGLLRNYDVPWSEGKFHRYLAVNWAKNALANPSQIDVARRNTYGHPQGPEIEEKWRQTFLFRDSKIVPSSGPANQGR